MECTVQIKYDQMNLWQICESIMDFNLKLLYSSNDFVADKRDRVAVSNYKQVGRPRKRGTRAGFLVRQQWRCYHTPLPSLILSNARSLANKVDELATQIVSKRDYTNLDYTNCSLVSVLCFTESWLDAKINDSVLQQMGFTL